MGRTGEWFASDHAGITPDAMTVGKAVGGIGLPLSATIYREELDTWGPQAHEGTFRGHAPAMIAGVRAIEYIEKHDLLNRASKLGNYLTDTSQRDAAELPTARRCTGPGAAPWCRVP